MGVRGTISSAKRIAFRYDLLHNALLKFQSGISSLFTTKYDTLVCPPIFPHLDGSSNNDKVMQIPPFPLLQHYITSCLQRFLPMSLMVVDGNNFFYWIINHYVDMINSNSYLENDISMLYSIVDDFLQSLASIHIEFDIIIQQNNTKPYYNNTSQLLSTDKLDLHDGNDAEATMNNDKLISELKNPTIITQSIPLFQLLFLFDGVPVGIKAQTHSNRQFTKVQTPLRFLTKHHPSIDIQPFISTLIDQINKSRQRYNSTNNNDKLDVDKNKTIATCSKHTISPHAISSTTTLAPPSTSSPSFVPPAIAFAGRHILHQQASLYGYRTMVSHGENDCEVAKAAWVYNADYILAQDGDYLYFGELTNLVQRCGSITRTGKSDAKSKLEFGQIDKIDQNNDNNHENRKNNNFEKNTERNTFNVVKPFNPIILFPDLLLSDFMELYKQSDCNNSTSHSISDKSNTYQSVLVKETCESSEYTVQIPKNDCQLDGKSAFIYDNTADTTNNDINNNCLGEKLHLNENFTDFSCSTCTPLLNNINSLLNTNPPIILNCPLTFDSNNFYNTTSNNNDDSNNNHNNNGGFSIRIKSLVLKQFPSPSPPLSPIPSHPINSHQYSTNQPKHSSNQPNQTIHSNINLKSPSTSHNNSQQNTNPHPQSHHMHTFCSGVSLMLYHSTCLPFYKYPIPKCHLQVAAYLLGNDFSISPIQINRLHGSKEIITILQYATMMPSRGDNKQYVSESVMKMFKGNPTVPIEHVSVFGQLIESIIQPNFNKIEEIKNIIEKLKLLQHINVETLLTMYSSNIDSDKPNRIENDEFTVNSDRISHATNIITNNTLTSNTNFHNNNAHHNTTYKNNTPIKILSKLLHSATNTSGNDVNRDEIAKLKQEVENYWLHGLHRLLKQLQYLKQSDSSSINSIANIKYTVLAKTMFMKIDEINCEVNGVPNHISTNGNVQNQDKNTGSVDGGVDMDQNCINNAILSTNITTKSTSLSNKPIKKQPILTKRKGTRGYQPPKQSINVANQPSDPLEPYKSIITNINNDTSSSNLISSFLHGLITSGLSLTHNVDQSPSGLSKKQHMQKNQPKSVGKIQQAHDLILHNNTNSNGDLIINEPILINLPYKSSNLLLSESSISELSSVDNNSLQGNGLQSFGASMVTITSIDQLTHSLLHKNTPLSTQNIHTNQQILSNNTNLDEKLLNVLIILLKQPYLCQFFSDPTNYFPHLPSTLQNLLTLQHSQFLQSPYGPVAFLSSVQDNLYPIQIHQRSLPRTDPNLPHTDSSLPPTNPNLPCNNNLDHNGFSSSLSPSPSSSLLPHPPLSTFPSSTIQDLKTSTSLLTLESTVKAPISMVEKSYTSNKMYKFIDTIKWKYHIEPGFITKQHPLLRYRLSSPLKIIQYNNKINSGSNRFDFFTKNGPLPDFNQRFYPKIYSLMFKNIELDDVIRQSTPKTLLLDFDNDYYGGKYSDNSLPLRNIIISNTNNVNTNDFNSDNDDVAALGDNHDVEALTLSNQAPSKHQMIGLLIVPQHPIIIPTVSPFTTLQASPDYSIKLKSNVLDCNQDAENMLSKTQNSQKIQTKNVWSKPCPKSTKPPSQFSHLVQRYYSTLPKPYPLNFAPVYLDDNPSSYYHIGVISPIQSIVDSYPPGQIILQNKQPLLLPTSILTVMLILGQVINMVGHGMDMFDAFSFIPTDLFAHYGSKSTSKSTSLPEKFNIFIKSALKHHQNLYINKFPSGFDCLVDGYIPWGAIYTRLLFDLCLQIINIHHSLHISPLTCTMSNPNYCDVDQDASVYGEHVESSLFNHSPPPHLLHCQLNSIITLLTSSIPSDSNQHSMNDNLENSILDSDQTKVVIMLLQLISCIVKVVVSSMYDITYQHTANASYLNNLNDYRNSPNTDNTTNNHNNDNHENHENCQIISNYPYIIQNTQIMNTDPQYQGLVITTRKLYHLCTNTNAFTSVHGKFYREQYNQTMYQDNHKWFVEMNVKTNNEIFKLIIFAIVLTITVGDYIDITHNSDDDCIMDLLVEFENVLLLQKNHDQISCSDNVQIAYNDENGIKMVQEQYKNPQSQPNDQNHQNDQNDQAHCESKLHFDKFISKSITYILSIREVFGSYYQTIMEVDGLLGGVFGAPLSIIQYLHNNNLFFHVLYLTHTFDLHLSNNVVLHEIFTDILSITYTVFDATIYESPQTILSNSTGTDRSDQANHISINNGENSSIDTRLDFFDQLNKAVTLYNSVITHASCISTSTCTTSTCNASTCTTHNETTAKFDLVKNKDNSEDINNTNDLIDSNLLATLITRIQYPQLTMANLIKSIPLDVDNNTGSFDIAGVGTTPPTTAKNNEIKAQFGNTKNNPINTTTCPNSANNTNSSSKGTQNYHFDQLLQYKHIIIPKMDIILSKSLCGLFMPSNTPSSLHHPTSNHFTNNTYNTNNTNNTNNTYNNATRSTVDSRSISDHSEATTTTTNLDYCNTQTNTLLPDILPITLGTCSRSVNRSFDSRFDNGIDRIDQVMNDISGKYNNNIATIMKSDNYLQQLHQHSDDWFGCGFNDGCNVNNNKLQDNGHNLEQNTIHTQLPPNPNEIKQKFECNIVCPDCFTGSITTSLFTINTFLANKNKK